MNTQRVNTVPIPDFLGFLRPAHGGLRADDQAGIAGDAIRLVSPLSGHPEIREIGLPDEGPGEGDKIGIAGGDGQGILFKKGRVIRKIDQDELVDQLLGEIDNMTKTSEE